jgi:hypothetical protein
MELQPGSHRGPERACKIALTRDASPSKALQPWPSQLPIAAAILSSAPLPRAMAGQPLPVSRFARSAPPHGGPSAGRSIDDAARLNLFGKGADLYLKRAVPPSAPLPYQKAPHPQAGFSLVPSGRNHFLPSAKSSRNRRGPSVLVASPGQTRGAIMLIAILNSIYREFLRSAVHGIATQRGWR